MARSKRVVGFLVAALSLPGLVACNAILGLDDFARTECGAEVCPFDGGPLVPNDARKETGVPDAKPPAPRGADPVSWAAFRMPNYRLGADAGVGTTAPPNALSYTSVNANEVKDNVTALVWRKAAERGGSPMTFEEAFAACTSIAPSGTWRLPKRIELVTLLDYVRPEGPFIDSANFSLSTRAWTSSAFLPFNPSDPRYWTVNFDEGVVETRAGGTAIGAALCVKAK